MALNPNISFIEYDTNHVQVVLHPTSNWRVTYEISVKSVSGSNNRSFDPITVEPSEYGASEKSVDIAYSENDSYIELYCMGDNVQNGDYESKTITHDLEYTKPEEPSLSIGDTFNDGNFIYEVTGESTVEVIGHLFGADVVVAYAEIPYSVKPTLENEYFVTSIKGDEFYDISFLELRISGDTQVDSDISILELSIDGDLTAYIGSGQNVYIENATSIRNQAFKNNTIVTEIHIPNTVTYIDSGTFDYCYNLTIYYDGTKSEWDSINAETIPDYVNVIFKGPNYNIKVKIDNNLRNVINIFHKQNNTLKSIKNFINK